MKSFHSLDLSFVQIRAVFFAAICPWCLAGAAPPEISGALAPLDNPTLETAKTVVASLESIANASPETNQIASEVASSLKGIFTQQYVLQNAGTALNARFLAARELDRKAFEHLRPNALGSINELAAEEKFKLAQGTRQKVITELNTAIIAMENALGGFRGELPKFTLSVSDQKLLTNAALAIETGSLNPARLELAARSKEVQQNPTKMAAKYQEDQAAEQSLKAHEERKRMLERIYRQAMKNRDYETAQRALSAMDGPSYVGNKLTKIVHSMLTSNGACQLEEIKEQVSFSSRMEAHAAGYSDCEHCK